MPPRRVLVWTDGSYEPELADGGVNAELSAFFNDIFEPNEEDGAPHDAPGKAPLSASLSASFSMSKISPLPKTNARIAGLQLNIDELAGKDVHLVKICADLYRGVAEPLLAGVEKLEFRNLAWTAADWRHMGGALACCTKLRWMNLTNMSGDDAAMAAFGGALGSGAAPALERLDLGYNNVGLDDNWQACGTGVNGSFHAIDGTPLINTKTFPSMADMTAHGHKLGLRVGWCEYACCTCLVALPCCSVAD